ncbi:hypothetical protein ES708_31430 [subsurface metagenome]
MNYGGVCDVKKCDMCFQDKTPLTPIAPGATAQVCKSCNYKLTQIVAFLEYYHVKLNYELPEKQPSSLPKATAKVVTDKS